MAERHPGEVVSRPTRWSFWTARCSASLPTRWRLSRCCALRDRVHIVYTAVCVMWRAAETRVSATDVKMRAYTDAEIEAYVETGDPLDKAGAYGIQDPQFAPVEAGMAATRQSWGCRWDWRRKCWQAGRERGRCRCRLRGMTGDRCCHRNGGLASRRREPCRRRTGTVDA